MSFDLKKFSLVLLTGIGLLYLIFKVFNYRLPSATLINFLLVSLIILFISRGVWNVKTDLTAFLLFLANFSFLTYLFNLGTPLTQTPMASIPLQTQGLIPLALLSGLGTGLIKIPWVWIYIGGAMILLVLLLFRDYILDLILIGAAIILFFATPGFPEELIPGGLELVNILFRRRTGQKSKALDDVINIYVQGAPNAQTMSGGGLLK